MEKKVNSKGKTQIMRLALSLMIILLIVSSFILYLSWPLLTGTTVILDTRPVDPFDLLRGQYMTIGYDIGSIEAIPGASVGDSVYVNLVANEEKVWVDNGASLTKPNTGVFIKGKINSLSSNSMRITYGIEQFFFERNANVPTRNVTVKVKVSSGGQARLVELLQNGEPVKISYQQKSITS